MSRSASARWIAAAGLVSLAAYFAWPVTTHHASAATRLEEFMPEWQFSEFHSIEIDASPQPIDHAIRTVTAGDIFLFRTLTWLRRLGQNAPEGILNAPERQPILDVATRTAFRLLSDEPGREIVFGSLVVHPPDVPPNAAPEVFRHPPPGVAKAVMNFRIDGRRLTTETRVFASDPATARRFALYWRLIYPGSWLLRHTWLRAIRARVTALAALDLPSTPSTYPRAARTAGLTRATLPSRAAADSSGRQSPTDHPQGGLETSRY